jgi:hypothetical protein
MEHDQRRHVKEGKIKVVAEINHGSIRGAPIDIHSEDEAEYALQRALRESFVEARHGRATSRAAGSSKGVKDYFDVDLAYSKTRPQQTIEACVKRVDHYTRIGRAWSKWFHANDIPGHKANYPYFIGVVKLTQDLSKGVPPPSFIIVCPLVFIFLSYTYYCYPYYCCYCCYLIVIVCPLVFILQRCYYCVSPSLYLAKVILLCVP